MSQQATRFRKRWVREIAANCGTGYELIFIIKCEYLSSEELKIIKRKNPTARFILYLWDSMLRIPGIEQKFHFFNKVFSFDRIDCQQQNMLSFNPLFYRHEYDNDDSLADFKYDLYHIGWYHSDRLELIKQISNYCEKNNLKAVLKIFTGYGGIYCREFSVRGSADQIDGF
ncbi:hypothetical protein LWM68_21155 [Niabella sp. W65]|nr:hypothetical protein [Niabella sp. W65]MCH7365042.1 hypothetical protein [Niabella sp. W65]